LFKYFARRGFEDNIVQKFSYAVPIREVSRGSVFPYRIASIVFRKIAREAKILEFQ